MAERILSRGRQISFEVEGQGEPIVLLHGLTLSKWVWRATGWVEPLLAAGRRVVLIDALGHGESEKPPEPADYTFEGRADDVAAVLDALGIQRAALLGYSMGGWTALQFAVRHPDRCTAAIAGGAHPYHESMEEFRRATGEGLPGWLAHCETMVGAVLPQPLRALILANHLPALKAVLEHDRPDISQELAASRVPLMFYCGEEDPRWAEALRFAERHGAAHLALPHLNHMQAMSAAELVLPPVLHFLGRREDRPGGREAGAVGALETEITG